MSNTVLAKAQVAAVTDDALDAGNKYYPDDPGVKRKGMCSRFSRCGTRKAYGQKYQGLFGGSAIETGERFQDAGFVAGGPPQMGDFLIKMVGSGGFGHIGCFVGDVPGIGRNLVAENSSTSRGRISGAKGYRTLEQYGHYDLIARLPTLEKEESTYRLFLNDTQIAVMPIRNGKAYCKAATWGKALGFDIAWDEENSCVLIDGKPLPASTQMFTQDGRAFVWIQDLRNFSGLKLSVDEPNRKIVVTR